MTKSVVRNNFVRNTGDDGLAMWSEKTADAGNAFDHNTVQTPDAGQRHRDLRRHRQHRVAQPGRRPAPRGQRLHVGSRFGAEPFAGHLTIKDNTTVRAGTLDLNWNIGLGAIWFYVLDKSIDADIQVTGDHYLDNTYNAIMLVSEWGVKDLYTLTGVKFKDIRVDGTGTSVLSARVKGSASFENVDARNVGAVGVNNCGSFGFPADRLGVLADRPGRQRRRLARRPGPEHHHLQRPPAGRRAARAVRVVINSGVCGLSG